MPKRALNETTTSTTTSTTTEQNENILPNIPESQWQYTTPDQPTNKNLPALDRSGRSSLLSDFNEESTPTGGLAALLTGTSPIALHDTPETIPTFSPTSLVNSSSHQGTAKRLRKDGPTR